MPTPSPEVQAFWRDYLRQLPPEHHHHGLTPDAFAFGGGGPLADELAALMLAGAKRATASLAVEFSAPGEPLPLPGSVSIILAADMRPVAIIERTTAASRGGQLRAQLEPRPPPVAGRSNC